MHAVHSEMQLMINGYFCVCCCCERLFFAYSSLISTLESEITDRIQYLPQSMTAEKMYDNIPT